MKRYIFNKKGKIILTILVLIIAAIIALVTLSSMGILPEILNKPEIDYPNSDSKDINGEETGDESKQNEPPAKSEAEIQAALAFLSDTSYETTYPDSPYIPEGAEFTMQLVNKVKGVSKDYVPDNLQLTKYRAKDRAESNQYMIDYAANAMDSMIEGAQAEGYTILVTTAYRSYNFQSVLYNNYVANHGQAAADTFSARPGTSEHQSGLAADLTSPSVNYQLTSKYGDTEEGKWLALHSHEYGFILRYTKAGEAITGYVYEPWHFRYVGTEVATEIWERGITLEEYIAEKY